MRAVGGPRPQAHDAGGPGAALGRRPGRSGVVKSAQGRMPFVLAPADFGRWLDPRAAKDPERQALLRPCPAEAMTAYPVGLRVHSPKPNGAACVAPLAV